MLTLYDIMVHYDPDTLKLAQIPPPVCPRCGSHRTEIVGTSDDGRTMTVRCNACGERSRIETATAASAARTAARDGGDGSDELDVMRVVGRALAQLPDAESRMRVLDWASGRFGPATTGDVSQPAPSQLAPSQPAPSQPSQDSGDLALSVEGMEELFVDPRDPRDAGDARKAARPAVPEQLESLVEGFVSDFQRVAVAWQSV